MDHLIGGAGVFGCIRAVVIGCYQTPAWAGTKPAVLSGPKKQNGWGKLRDGVLLTVASFRPRDALRPLPAQPRLATLTVVTT